MSNLSWSDQQQINRIRAFKARAESSGDASIMGKAWWIIAEDIRAMAEATCTSSDSDEPVAIVPRIYAEYSAAADEDAIALLMNLADGEWGPSESGDFILTSAAQRLAGEYTGKWSSVANFTN